MGSRAPVQVVTSRRSSTIVGWWHIIGFVTCAVGAKIWMFAQGNGQMFGWFNCGKSGLLIRTVDAYFRIVTVEA